MSEKAIKTRYSDEELQEFANIINQKLEKSNKELYFYLSHLSEMADNPDSKIKGLDDGNGTAENERISILAARLKKHIQHLENAQIRIKNKAYGICRETGRLIAKERLRAVPHATLSIKAKQQKSST